MHVLVSGASGFIGWHLACGLARRGFQVTALYRRIASLPAVAPPAGVRLLRADLSTLEDLPSTVDAVVHAAATSPWSGITADDIVRDNVLGTRMLIRYALEAGARRFLFASSLSVYGRITAPVVNEATPLVDPDAYGLSKRLCELLLTESAGRMPALALRLPGVIGRGAHRNFLATTLERLRAGEPVMATNPEAPFNNATHVGDLEDFVARLLDTAWPGFDSLVLGARGQTTIRAAVERLARGCGSQSAIAFRPANRPAFTIDSRRAMEYGYDPGHIDTLLDRFAYEEREI